MFLALTTIFNFYSVVYNSGFYVIFAFEFIHIAVVVK